MLLLPPGTPLSSRHPKSSHNLCSNLQRPVLVKHLLCACLCLRPEPWWARQPRLQGKRATVRLKSVVETRTTFRVFLQSSGCLLVSQPLSGTQGSFGTDVGVLRTQRGAVRWSWELLSPKRRRSTCNSENVHKDHVRGQHGSYWGGG